MRIIERENFYMKKLFLALFALVISLAGSNVQAATPQEVLTFFNDYVNAANTYSDKIPTYYAPDAKIISSKIESSFLNLIYLLMLVCAPA